MNGQVPVLDGGLADTMRTIARLAAMLPFSSEASLPYMYREREHYNFTTGFPRISFPSAISTTVSLARKIQPFRSKSEFDTLADVINMHGGGPGGVAQCFNVTYDG